MSNSLNDTVLQLELPGIRKLKSGKVREVFDLGDRLLFVATDRISAFDCIMPNGIPRKGEVLTQISYFWFAQTESFQPNHLLSGAGRSVAKRIAAVRGPTRAALHDREKSAAAGHRMRRARLPRRLRLEGISKTPDRLRHQTARRDCGIVRIAGADFHAGHQGRIRPRRKHFLRGGRKIVGDEIAEQARAASLKIYNFARDYARKRGIIIADTKFEFGLFDGKLILIDEVLTPDSSRFWPADQYSPAAASRVSTNNSCAITSKPWTWNKTPPAPVILLPPDSRRQNAQAKYLDGRRGLVGAYERN
jgi:phosphoribosylaminoimidazole-succinocarboxamide synthase